ncbi:MAG: BCCT family transporter, partial [Bacteroidota bacterium]
MANHENNPNESKGRSNKLFDIHGPVFWPSAILITLLIVSTLIAGDAAEEAFNAVRVGITDWASWLFVLSV